MSEFDYMNDWSVDQKKDWLRREISPQAWETLPGTVIYAGLWADGFRLRESDFLEVRREGLAVARKEHDISSLGADDMIPLSHMIENTSFNQSRRFHYRLVAYGDDPDSGEPKPFYFSISSDEQLTRGELEGAVDEMIKSDPNAYHLIASEVEFYRGYIKEK